MTWVGTGGHRDQGKGGLGPSVVHSAVDLFYRPTLFCRPTLSCAAPVLDAFGFLLDSSSQTTVLRSRRHDTGQGHTPEDWSLDCSSQEGMLTSALEEGRASRPP